MSPTATALAELLERALASGDDYRLQEVLMAGSGLPGHRLNLRLVGEFAGAVGAVAVRPEPPVAALEALLDRWAALSPAEAPGDRPAVILPCAAVASYGEVGAVRPAWWPDEMAKLRAAAPDRRWRVGEAVAQALQRLLGAEWSATMAALADWTADPDPLVVRAAAAAVSEPALLADAGAAAAAADTERRAVAAYQAAAPATRRTEAGRVLRQALAFTISVTTAATGDFSLLRELAGSGDRDLRWIAVQNLSKARLRPWAEDLAATRELVDRS